MCSGAFSSKFRDKKSASFDGDDEEDHHPDHDDNQSENHGVKSHRGVNARTVRKMREPKVSFAQMDGKRESPDRAIRAFDADVGSGVRRGGEVGARLITH